MTDPIADMLTRIRNASAVKKDEVILPMSKIKYSIAKILEEDGWIKKAEADSSTGFSPILLFLFSSFSIKYIS